MLMGVLNNFPVQKHSFFKVFAFFAHKFYFYSEVLCCFTFLWLFWLPSEKKIECQFSFCFCNEIEKLRFFFPASPFQHCTMEKRDAACHFLCNFVALFFFTFAHVVFLGVCPSQCLLAPYCSFFWEDPPPHGRATSTVHAILLPPPPQKKKDERQGGQYRTGIGSPVFFCAKSVCCVHLKFDEP